MTKKKYKTKQSIYTKIVGFFLILTVAAIFVILHFALAKVTIKAYSPTETKTYSGLVELLPENSLEATAENLLGKIITKELELTVSVPASQEATTAEYAGGLVTIINNYSQNQPLIKTTRLLTPDNKLYRIQAGVTVPAGGQVEVWAQADQPGEQFAIGATKMTIPGLWSGLQDKIYAETQGFNLTGEPRYQVTAENLNQAQKQLKEEAVAQGLVAINDLLSNNLKIDQSQLFANYKTLESSQVGEETNQATLKQKVTLFGLVFSPEDLLTITKNKLAAELEDNQKVINTENGTFQYEIIEIYPEREQAVLEVTLDANISSTQHLFKIDKDELIGKTEIEVKNYLEQFNVDRAEIKFFPFWIKTVPKLKDHIIIE